jgi:hypothetical protein
MKNKIKYFLLLSAVAIASLAMTVSAFATGDPW